MIQSIYTGRAGLTSIQLRVDVIAANIANVNTTAYKSSRMDFKEALYQEMQRVIEPEESVNMQLGHGVLPATTLRNFKQGALTPTRNPLDVAIEGDGFFAVENAAGEVEYIRNGTLHISQGDSVGYLVNTDGKYLLNTDGERIQVNGFLTDLSIGPTGLMTFGTESQPFAQLGVYTFRDREKLEAVGGSAYVPTEASGEAELGEPKVVQGYVESSNVDIGMEMTRLIRTQRAFQLAARCVTNADRMEEIANGLRG